MLDSNTHLQNIGCAAWGWREVDIPEYFHWISHHGIRLVEVNAHPGSPKHLLDSCDDESVNKIAAWAESAGVDIICIAARNIAFPKLVRYNKRASANPK